jgi:hypothetical protein
MFIYIPYSDYDNILKKNKNIILSPEILPSFAGWCIISTLFPITIRKLVRIKSRDDFPYDPAKVVYLSHKQSENVYLYELVSVF